MDTSSFLSLILPQQGIYCAALPVQKSKDGKEYLVWQHQTFSTINGMASWLEDADRQGKTVYHTCASLLAPKMTVEKLIKGELKPKTVVRVAENIGYARSFWLDIDVGPGKDYETRKAALEGLYGFVKKYQLPSPLIVASGGGLHVYWPTDKDMTAAVWKPLAERFKAIVAKAGLRTDRTRTADSCSILRPVGTHNRKAKYETPRRVYVMNKNPVAVTSYSEWIALLGEMENALKIIPILPSIGSLFSDGSSPVGLGVNLSASLADIPKEVDPKQVVSSCQQMKKFALSQGNVPEPYWRAALSIIRFFPNGRKQAHRLSAGHPDYSEDGTDTKLDELIDKDVGPYRCETFESVNPTGCDGCDFRGNISSPIRLGEIYKSAPAPQVVVGGATLEIPNPPEPYTRSETGQVIIQPKEGPDGNKPAAIVIYPYDLYPITRVYDAVHKQESVLWRVHLPIDGVREFSIPLGMIYNNNSLSELLANTGILVKLGKAKERIVNYIIEYTNELQRTQKSRDFSARMGWQADDSQFVLGHTAYMDDGRVLPVPKALMEKNVAADRYIASRGDLVEWKSVINTYGRIGQEPFAFGFLSGLGAVLYKMTGFDGCIVSIIDDGGTGKTTMQQAIMSIYGNPDNKDVLITPQDTEKTVIAKLAALSNIPVILDDFSGTDEKDIKALADLCYAVSQGKGRDRLNQDGTISDRRERWSTIGVISSNRSVYSRLHNYRGQATAESMRVFEYLGPNKADIDVSPSEARALFREKLPYHYGLAGPLFVAYVVANYEKVRLEVVACMKEVEAIVGETSAERYWISLIAANITAGRIAKMLGLLDWDVEAVLIWACSRIKDTREKVAGFKVGSTPVLSDFLNEHIDQVAIFDHDKWQNQLRGKVVARWEKHKDSLYVATNQFRIYCNRNGHDTDEILKSLQAACVLTGRNQTHRLTSHTNIVSGPSKCFVINTAHLDFTGATKLELVSNKVEKPLDPVKTAV